MDSGREIRQTYVICTINFSNVTYTFCQRLKVHKPYIFFWNLDRKKSIKITFQIFHPGSSITPSNLKYEIRVQSWPYSLYTYPTSNSQRAKIGINQKRKKEKRSSESSKPEPASPSPEDAFSRFRVKRC